MVIRLLEGAAGCIVAYISAFRREGLGNWEGVAPKLTPNCVARPDPPPAHVTSTPYPLTRTAIIISDC